MGSRLGDGQMGAEHDPLGTRRLFLPFASSLFIGAGLLGILSAGITSAFADPPPGYQAPGVFIPSVLGLLTGLFARLFVERIGFRPWLIHSLLAGAGVLIGVATYFSGYSVAPFGAMLFIWVVLVATAMLELRAAALHIAAAGVTWAFLLAIMTGHEQATEPSDGGYLLGQPLQFELAGLVDHDQQRLGERAAGDVPGMDLLAEVPE